MELRARQNSGEGLQNVLGPPIEKKRECDAACVGGGGAGEKNGSVGFSPGKLRMHVIDNGVFNRKP
jgi:hypothetical protein